VWDVSNVVINVPSSETTQVVSHLGRVEKVLEISDVYMSARERAEGGETRVCVVRGTARSRPRKGIYSN